MKSVLSLIVCFAANLCLLSANGPDSVPAPSNVPGAEYPRIDSDLTVTFRVKAADARQVQLEGGAGLVKAPLEMTRGDDGVWSVTTPPAVPGFHYYWFNVDGLRVNDSGSYTYFGYGRECSGIEVPEAGTDFHAAKDVPHGEIRTRWYFSNITGKWRRAFVYTPADYDGHPKARFPVLYLLHGAGENERGWIEQGRANFILDNLIAAGRARPMLLVIDTGYAIKPGIQTATNQPSGSLRNTAAFPEVLLQEIIPVIDANYRTRPEREFRALAGLSMGSMQALDIGLRRLDQFAWIGAMSRPPFQSVDLPNAYGGVFGNPDEFNKRVKLLWFSAGTAETRFHETAVVLCRELEKAGINAVFYSSPGTDHEWQTWRRSLHELVPRLFL